VNLGAASPTIPVAQPMIATGFYRIGPWPLGRLLQLIASFNM
jgi:hypothetical protein